MKQQLHNLRQKPEHVRKQYAYTSAAAVTLSIFMIWGVTMVVTKPLAYKGTTEATEERGNPISELASTFKTGLAGAAASIEEVSAELEAPGQYEGEARLEIVETGRSSTIDEEPERETVLTF
tara:strand:- start:2135 stop:2500 length:366 start_codon:yes stop_codon:yes gene_type:complete